MGLFYKHFISVISMYGATHSDKREDLSILGTDYIFTAPTRHILLEVYNQTQSSNVYLYQFDHNLSFDGWGPRYPFCVNHSCHGAELPFVFQQFSGFVPSPEEQVLSNRMVKYWTNFAYTGNPNIGPQDVSVNWQSITNTNLNYMLFSTPEVKLQSGLRKAQCDLWDKLGYNFGT
jgi:carboxylesterase type B